MVEKIRYKCSHPNKEFANRTERIRERGRKLEVPAEAIWHPVQDVRGTEHGIPELYDVEGVYYTIVECPVCGATNRVQTDKRVK